MRLTADDEAKVAAAIRDAESRTDGEVAAIVIDASDSYADVVLHWSLIAALFPLALAAAWPAPLLAAAGLFVSPWEDAPPMHLLLTILLFATAIVFVAARLLFGIPPVRMTLTPAATKARRVRRRAIMLFRTGTERRTATRTGVLLFLSLAEHRAEIVADRAIHAKVKDSVWGEAMASLIEALRDDRAGDGMAVAIGRIADVLAEHFPHTGTDPNELPDRLIRL